MQANSVAKHLEQMPIEIFTHSTQLKVRMRVKLLRNLLLHYYN